MAEENTESVESQENVEETQHDEALGEGGLKALKAEREAHAEASKRAKELEARLAEFERAEQERKDAELSEVERLQKKLAEVEASEASARLDSARNAALAKFPVPDEYQDLVVGSDAESFEASAKKLHELHSKASAAGVYRGFVEPKSGNSAPVDDEWEAAAAKARARYGNS